MAEERPIHEVLLDCFVYAPVGAALVALEEVPRLAERGRERIGSHVALARLLGQFAVGEGRRRFGAPPPSSSRSRAGRESGSGGSRHHTEHRADSGVGHADRPDERSGEEDDGVAESSAEILSAGSAVATGPSRDLPIPAYDTLAASQVVERLASLSAPELEAVRRHESATRRRRTVLHRIAQLSAERGATA